MKIKIITAFGAIVLLSACSSLQTNAPTAAETASAARSVELLNNAPSAYAPVKDAKVTRTAYRPAVVSDLISPQDTLDINVFKVPDLSVKNLIVENSGMISLPLIGSVQLTGLTISQAEQRVTQRLQKFMQDPKVSIIRTDKALSSRVTVEGEVKTPGVFPIKRNLSFLQAIAMSQGLTELGDAKTILFYRDGRQHNVNLELVRTGRIPDPILRGDDRIVVLKDPVKVREKKMLDYLPVITAPLSFIPGL